MSIIFMCDCCIDSTFVALHSVFLIKASHLHISFIMTIQRRDQVDCEFPTQCPSINRACYLNKPTNFFNFHTPNFSGFGGLVVSMLASGTQDHGFAPGRSRQIFQAKKKNPQHAFLWKGSKAICPMSQIYDMSKNPIIYLGSRKLYGKLFGHFLPTSVPR
jgi:hypothetical protein